MTLHPIIDLLKRIVIALPDYAGGGGSAWEHVQYTLAEDWTTTAAGGNTINFYDTFLSGTRGKIVIAVISNNTVTGLSKATSVVGINEAGYTPSTGSGNNIALCFFRGNPTNALATTYDFFLSAGSVIDVYSCAYPWGGN